MLLTFSIILIGCGQEEVSQDTTADNAETTEENNVQGSKADTAEQKEETTLSKIKMITLGTDKAMRYAERYNIEGEENFREWYEDIFYDGQYFDQLLENSQKASTKLNAVTVEDVEVKPLEEQTFAFDVTLSYEIQDVAVEDEAVTTTSKEKVEFILVQDENGEYKIKSFNIQDTE
jgi:D-alanyl-D-alanine dipeptidase